MKPSYTLISLIAFLATTTLAWSQETIQYPYNPDVDNDAFVATSDLQGFLAQFGQDFQPAPVLIDSVDLLSVIQMMQAQITALQVQVATLENQVVPELSQFVEFIDSSSTLSFTGVNVQIQSGAFSTTPNGKGNLIIGQNRFNEELGEPAREGSHNLVVGDFHSYNGTNNFLSGIGNGVWSDFGAIMAGTGNQLGTDSTLVENSAIVSGKGNIISGGDPSQSVIVGGQNNIIGSYSNDTRFSVITGGRLNKMLEDGYCGFIGGGYGNQILSGGQALTNSSGLNRSIIGGLFNQSHGSNSSVMVGGSYDTMFPIDSVDSRGHVNLPVETFLGGVQPDNGSNTQVTGSTPD